MLITAKTLVISELRAIQARDRLTQEQLAERIGVTQPAVSAWLRGASLPTSESLAKLKSAFPELAAVVVRAALEPILGDSTSANAA
jgi:transcriptional regulator with XRE-family HTH domain